MSGRDQYASFEIRRYQCRTNNDISFATLLLNQIRVIESADHSAELRVRLLDRVCFILRPDQSSNLIFRMLLVEHVKRIAADIPGRACEKDLGCHVDARLVILQMYFTGDDGMEKWDRDQTENRCRLESNNGIFAFGPSMVWICVYPRALVYLTTRQ